VRCRGRLLAFGALPALRGVWKAFDRPPPTEPPPNWPVWPLWYAPYAFVHTRRAGLLFVVGLAIGAIFKL
jgi:1,4-dihydroxy-2-naphthoate octaprenyltransferase